MCNRYSRLAITLLLSASLTGCLHSDDSNGNSGLTEEQVRTMLEPITERLDELESADKDVSDIRTAVENLSNAVNVVVAIEEGGNSKTMSRIQKLATSHVIDCASSGYLPFNQLRAQYTQCTTSAGYMVNVPKAGGPPQWVNAWYESTNCTGTPYVTLREVVGATSSGVVFSYYDAQGHHVGYFSPNPTTVTRTIQSVYSEPDGCEGMGGMIVMEDLIEILPHDATAAETTKAENSYPPNTAL